MMRKICLLLFVFASFSACKKDTSLPTVSTFFGRFNGFISSISTQNPPGLGVADLVAINTTTDSIVSNGTYISALGGGGIVVSFTKATLVYPGVGAPPQSAFQSFFAPGSVPYINATNANGIAIGYADKNGISWNSALGDQTGSVFTITASQSSGSNMIVEALFNCKLFDSAGDSLTLSGGMFTGQFKPQ